MQQFNFQNHLVQISDNGNRKVFSTDGSFHLAMKYDDGLTMKWGKTEDEDPTHCPWGPEIADIEITTKCPGIRGMDGVRNPCPWCYKSNTVNGKNMSFETFKHIFDLLNAKRTLTQIAFGADAALESNPDIWKMFEYCRENFVVPNVTIADISPETAKKIVSICGAVAVSWYPTINPDRCYDTVYMLCHEADKQGKNLQVNIHALLSKESYKHFGMLLHLYRYDARLSGMNAIVLLSLKKKGRGKSFNTVEPEQFEKLIDKFFERGVRFGMDSCSCNKFFRYIDKHPEKEDLKSVCEPCESTLYSSYINSDGVFFPCSFMEGEGNWKDGIDLNTVKDFEREVWNHEKVFAFRNSAIKKIEQHGCNSCPYYEV